MQKNENGYWYKLMIVEGSDANDFMGSGVDKVTCTSGADIADFKGAVKDRNPNKIKNVDDGDLTVFEEKKIYMTGFIGMSWK